MAQTTDALSEEAARWFVLLQGGASAGERAAFERWLDEPAHAVAYTRIEATWERTERLKAASIMESGAVRTRRTGALVTRRAAAAALVAGLAGGGAWMWSRRAPTYVTAVGERKSVRLADGSTVHLNTASRLAVDFTEARRDVKLLEGEALFEVAKDKARPFVVSAGSAQVRAVGTAFNVRLRKDVVEVTVTEGVVAVTDRSAPRASASEPPRHVSAGRGAVVGPGAIEEVALDGDTLARRTSWRNGVLEFRGETLQQAVDEFNRYRQTRIVIGDPSIASMRVGGTFETNESEKFLGALAGLKVKATEGEGGVIYLTPAA